MRISWIAVLLVVLAVAACRSKPLSDPNLPPGSFRIEGTRFAKKADLVRAAYLELASMGRGEQRKAYAYDAAYSMERFLRDEGWPDARVAFEMEGETAVFHVEEGKIAAIRDVRFEGVHAVSESTLREFFGFPGSGILGNGPVFFPDAKIQSAAADVRSYYLSKGHYRVEVGEIRQERGADPTCMDLVVPIEEGPVYRVRSVELEGDDPALLGSTVWIGKVFHGGVNQEITSRVRDRLLDEGYPNARVRTEVEVDDEATAVDLRVRVDRGEPLRLDHVRFEGQRRTSTAFMRKMIPLAPGQLFRRKALDAGMANLYAMGVFGRMDMRLEPTRPGYADMVVKVTEPSSRQIDFGAGLGTWEIVRATVTYRDFNFLGRGIFLRARGVASIRRLSLDTTVEDPWILGKKNVLTWTGGVLRRHERYYTSRGYYTELRVERRLDKSLRLRAGYRFRSEEAIKVSTGIPRLDLSEILGFSQSAGLWGAIRWDRRDHLFLPTKGWLGEVEVFWSTPALGASLEYIGIDVNGSYFFDLGGLGVLALDALFRTKQILDGMPILPIQERFFLGGSESVRAYGQDRLTP
ncbi:MAG: outer membrane protein assembly factor, partial [Planctomycetota bacterium]